MKYVLGLLALATGLALANPLSDLESRQVGSTVKCCCCLGPKCPLKVRCEAIVSQDTCDKLLLRDPLFCSDFPSTTRTTRTPGPTGPTIITTRPTSTSSDEPVPTTGPGIMDKCCCCSTYPGPCPAIPCDPSYTREKCKKILDTFPDMCPVGPF